VIQTKVEIDAPASVFWQVIADYEKYPEFLKDLKNVKVQKTEGNKKTVFHEAEIVKPITYTLELFEEVPLKKLSWRLIDCSKVSIAFIKFKVIEKNEGWWDVIENGPDKCTGVYNIDIKLNSKIPAALTEPVLKKNLPGTMAAFKKRTEELAAKK